MIWRRARTSTPPSPPDPTRNLMARYCDGDAAAFRELYALLAPLVLADLGSRGCAGDRAAQVLEAAFLNLHRDRAVYVRGADPGPWLLAIARRHAHATPARAVVTPAAPAHALSA